MSAPAARLAPSAWRLDVPLCPALGEGKQLNRRGAGWQVVAPYYARPRRTPPRTGTTLFVAGLNFITSERVRRRFPPALPCVSCCALRALPHAGGKVRVRAEKSRHARLRVLFAGAFLAAMSWDVPLLRAANVRAAPARQEVEAKFGKYGTCKEARIVRNPMNGESRGFGFVAMKHEEARSRAGSPRRRHSCTPLLGRMRSSWCAHACFP